MKTRLLYRYNYFFMLLCVGIICGFAPAAMGQTSEQEPNNTCQTAQNVGAVSLPFTMYGNLNSTLQNPDVDFYKFVGVPNTKIVADVEGQSTYRGTLPDPFVGLFNSACTLVDTNDDGGYGHNARIQFTVPADGIFILGVSRCCDPNFTGGGIGTYALTVAVFVDIRYISGGVVDAASGAPLTGYDYPYARVELHRCSNGQCQETVMSQGVDSNGRFKFDRYPYDGRAIPAGTYQIWYSAHLYAPAQSQIFTVAQGEARELGNFPLTSVPVIGSINGRMVDSRTNAPLQGNTYPYARAELRRCMNGQCYDYVASQSTDNIGRYKFDRDYSNRPLPTGTYQVTLSANLYTTIQLPMFTIGQGEDKNLGDSLMVQMPLAGSISGRLVNANTGQAIPGNTAPYAYVSLNRCNQYGCYYSIAYQNADSNGRFRFDRDSYGNPLTAGTYQVVPNVPYFQSKASEAFTVAEAENKELGDVKVPPIALRFSDIQFCTSIPSGGGSCTFGATLTNGLPTLLYAKAWSVIETYSQQSNRFQITNPPIVSIPSGGSKAVQFRLEVPDSVPNGTAMCPRIYVGQSSSLDPKNDKNASYFSLLGQSYTFCIVKNQNVFRVLSESESQTLLRTLTAQPPSAEATKPNGETKQ